MTGIGKRIEQLLSNKNLKRVEFADILNINQAYVTKLIKGERNPSERLIEDICEKFSIRREWLVDGDLPMEANTVSQTLDKITKRYYNDGNETFRAILDVYANLDEKDQESIEKYINLLSQRIAAGISPVNSDMNVTTFMAGEKEEESPAQDAQGE